tara:strand:- start:690 stop:962 length:273 start_codon:yes stop_codon:yes gene_type:complete
MPRPVVAIRIGKGKHGTPLGDDTGTVTTTPRRRLDNGRTRFAGLVIPGHNVALVGIGKFRWHGGAIFLSERDRRAARVAMGDTHADGAAG